MTTLLSRAALAAAAMALGLSGAHATVYDASKSLNVTLTVQTACSITAVPSITFDTLTGGAQTTLDNQYSTVQVSCNAGTWHIMAATDPSGLHGRTMTLDANDVVAYQLCVDQTPLTAYGNCNALSTTKGISGSGTGSATIQAVIMPGQSPAPGTYIDSVVLQLTN